MKILSYNLFGIIEPNLEIPNWESRIKNIELILNNVLTDEEIKICCFQEVNDNNLEILNSILIENNFKMLEQYPMKTQSLNQYNIIAIKKADAITNISTVCLPHGKDTEYKSLEIQVIDYNMSDYRTTVFAYFKYKTEAYLIGNIHTDYISTEGKIKGTVKSLNYMDKVSANYKILVGDMNMISHMSEVYNVLKENKNYSTLSRSKDFDTSDNSWHGYGLKEQVNVDFAFVEKSKINQLEYRIIKQKNILNEGSDHRPVIIEIN